MLARCARAGNVRECVLAANASEAVVADQSTLERVDARRARSESQKLYLSIDHSSAVTYLHRGDMFGQRCPVVKEKLKTPRVADSSRRRS
mgnify:CR=1 FL=1